MNSEQIDSQNKDIFDQVKEKYIESVNCAKKIKDYLYEKFSIEINDEELLYLSIHINRLISRIDEWEHIDNAYISILE